MSKKTIFKSVLAVVVLGLIGTLAVVYLLASALPKEYRPASLSSMDRISAADRFIDERILGDFNDGAQGNSAYLLSFSEVELNEYLSSLEEI